MRKRLVFSIIGIICAWQLGLGASGTLAEGPGLARGKGLNQLEKTAADVIAATMNYRAALERLLPIYEREVARRDELADLQQDLFERGVLSKREFEGALRARADARKNLEDTRLAIADTDRMLTEARMAEALAKLMPLTRGGYEETAGLARFNGPASWSLTRDTPLLQQFFLGRFGRPLPISAFGQTGLHDRMGFDHRNALDIALHPDSPEGRGLMDYLRSVGIPFIAAWGAIPGSASGAHIHVGQPSPRMSARRRCC